MSTAEYIHYIDGHVHDSKDRGGCPLCWGRSEATSGSSEACINQAPKEFIQVSEKAICDIKEHIREEVVQKIGCKLQTHKESIYNVVEHIEKFCCQIRNLIRGRMNYRLPKAADICIPFREEQSAVSKFIVLEIFSAIKAQRKKDVIRHERARSKSDGNWNSAKHHCVSYLDTKVFTFLIIISETERYIQEFCIIRRLCKITKENLLVRIKNRLRIAQSWGVQHLSVGVKILVLHFQSGGKSFLLIEGS